MSKLLTDLMEAERKRRRLALGPGAGEVQEGAGERVVADQAATATLSCTVAEAEATEPAASPATLSRAMAEQEAPAETASSQPGPERTGWRLFAVTALSLMAGVGAGLWLGKPPAVSVPQWSADRDVLRLRLDDKLMNSPLQENLSIPGDRAQLKGSAPVNSGRD